MRKIITAFAIIFAHGGVYGQQISINSQYLFNHMLLNPAATGSKEYISVHTTFRRQWTTFPGSPTTQSLSADGEITKNLGLGGVLFNDVAGPSRRTGVSLNAAYHLPLDENQYHKLGAGIGVNLAQHFIDINKITTYLPDDPAVMQGFNNQFVPDVNFGFYYRFKDVAHVGFSATNLVQTTRDLFRFNYTLRNPVVRTYYFNAGYNIRLGKESKSRINTATLFRAIETGTFQFDVTALYEWDKRLWIGGSYRFKDAVSIMTGARVGPVRFGYSYDYALSDIGAYTTGSHEVFIELMLKYKKSSSRTPWLKRNRIYSPE